MILQFITRDLGTQTVNEEITKNIQYIPLINRVRGPYRKLRTRVFFHSYGPSAKREGHEEKNEVRNLRYGSSNEVNKMFIIWPFLVFVTRTERN